MDKHTIWHMIYSGRTVNREAFDRYFRKNGDDGTRYIYYVERDCGPLFELHAHISGDKLISVEPFKADVYGGHGRPVVNERNLTSTEKKYAVSVLEECFQDRVGDKLAEVIEKAKTSQVEFDGYKIEKTLKDGVIFFSPNNKKVKIAYKTIVKAVDYSHLDLAILRDVEVIREYAYCFGIKNYEPLAAILLTINPTSYPEYFELERQYRYGKMQVAVNRGDVTTCEAYIDVLSNPKNNVQVFCEEAVKQDNKTLLIWLINNIPKENCNLSFALAIAIKRNNKKLFKYLLDSGLIDVATSDLTRWNSPMYVAVGSGGREEYILPLLKYGFSLPAKMGYRYYSTLSFAKLKKLLPYKVEFDLSTVNRIYAKKQDAIIVELEKKPLRYCCEGVLLHASIESRDFERFSEIIKKRDIDLLAKEVVESGTQIDVSKWFEMAFANGPKWTDALIEYGFDINWNDAKLLHNACKNLNSEMVIYLLNHGANPRLKSKYSETVFEKAAGFHGYLDNDQQKEKERICQYLLEIGLDPIEESRQAPSILNYLLGKTTGFDFVLVLVDWLAERRKINIPDLPDECQDTKHLPISYILNVVVASDFNPNVFRYFIKKGAIMNAEGLTEDRLFLCACKVCELEDLQLAVSAGANVNETDEYYGTNGLYEAIKNKCSFDVVKYLVDLGLDVNSVRDVAKSKFARPTKMELAESVLDIAEAQGDNRVVEYLKAHGALHASELT